MATMSESPSKFNKYSFSSLTKFKECGFAFKLHYIDKIRPTEEPGALSFGSAIDKAFTAMLIPGEKTAEQVFLEEWTEDKILTGNQKFSKSDFDSDIIPIGWTNDGSKFTGDILDLMTFESLKQKGLIILQALREKLLPKIEKVYGVQVPISLKNQDGEGDEFIGFIDFVIKLKGYDKPIIGDLKTTSVKYEADAVKKSPQLTVYTYAAGSNYGTNLAGFFVVNKKINKTKHQTCTKCGFKDVNNRAKTCTKEDPKRCGGAWDTRLTFDSDVNILVDEIGLEQEEQVLTDIDQAHSLIKQGVFEQNFQSCIHPVYRKKCPFYALCHEGKMDGLVVKGVK
jgi:hypothetical protein